LKRNHLHAGLAEFGCKDAADRSGADDDNISLFRCHDSPPVPWSLRLQAEKSSTRKGFLALHVGRRKGRMRARESDKLPARKILVAAVDRVGKHALDRVRAQRVEKSLLR